MIGNYPSFTFIFHCNRNLWTELFVKLFKGSLSFFKFPQSVAGTRMDSRTAELYINALKTRYCTCELEFSITREDIREGNVIEKGYRTAERASLNTHMKQRQEMSVSPWKAYNFHCTREDVIIILRQPSSNIENLVLEWPVIIVLSQTARGWAAPWMAWTSAIHPSIHPDPSNARGELNTEEEEEVFMYIWYKTGRSLISFMSCATTDYCSSSTALWVRRWHVWST